MGVVTIGLVSDLAKHQVTVKCHRREACGSCAQKDDCAVSTVSGLLSKEVILVLPRPSDMKLTLGQLVGVEVQEHVLLKSIVTLLLFPLIFLLLGLFLGAGFDDSGEAFAMLGAAVGLGTGLLFGRICSIYLVGKPSYRLVPYELIACHKQ